MNRRLIALDFITGCLRVNPPSSWANTLRTIVDSCALDWRTIITIADSEMIGPVLWSALYRMGLAAAVPDEVREHLRKAHLLNALRNVRFKEQALTITGALNALGVQPTILKGGASLFVSTYDDLGCRVMADLDILVPPDAAQVCWDAIRGLGYSPIEIGFDPFAHHHLIPLRSQSAVGTIEVHRALLAPAANTIVPEEFILQHLESVNESGAWLSVPDPTLQILHILLHSGVVDREYARGSMCLRALHELAIIQATHFMTVDWESICDLMTRSGTRKILDGFAYRAHRIFWNTLPHCVPPTWRAVIHNRRARLQASSPALGSLIDFGMLFSRQSICERYGCNDDFLSVAAGRLRRAGSLAWHPARNATKRMGEAVAARSKVERRR